MNAWFLSSLGLELSERGPLLQTTLSGTRLTRRKILSSSDSSSSQFQTFQPRINETIIIIIIIALCHLPIHQNSPTMSDENKSSEPENVPEHICALFHQLNPEHIINGIKKTVSGDIEHLFDMARSRELNAGTIIMLFDEAMKTRTGHVTLIALAAAALVVCIVMLVYPMSVAAPFLGALGFTHAGPAAGKTTAVYFLLLVC